MNKENVERATVANRVATWAAILGMGVYVMDMGRWVGAADEKFDESESVEIKQEQLILDVNTLTVEQKHIKTTVDANKKAIEDSKKEILAAIKEAHKDDE